jgi:DNA-binding MarR family transcriptional regulator
MARNRTKPLTEMAERIERDVREMREKLRRPLEAEFARGQLTGPQRSVIQAVFHSEGVSLKELCSRVSLSHSTVSGIVDRLVARGMLERRVDETDHRFSNIRVTKAVRDFMRRKAPYLIAQPLARALARATPAERKKIFKGLELLRRVIGIDAVHVPPRGSTRSN